MNTKKTIRIFKNFCQAISFTALILPSFTISAQQTHDPFPAISALVPMDFSHHPDYKNYLAISDAKNYGKEANNQRFFYLNVMRPRENIFIPPIPLQVDWQGLPESNDLEGACALTQNTLLVAESGYYQGKYGRLFYLSLNPQTNTLKVEGAWRYQHSFMGNFEGLACQQDKQDPNLQHLILGERDQGGLYYATINTGNVTTKNIPDLNEHLVGYINLKFHHDGYDYDVEDRIISDLFFDKNRLYAVASHDNGVFKQSAEDHIYSTVYQTPITDLSTLDQQEPNVNDIMDLDIIWRFPTTKIEALTEGLTDAQFLVASDNDGPEEEIELIPNTSSE